MEGFGVNSAGSDVGTRHTRAWVAAFLFFVFFFLMHINI